MNDDERLKQTFDKLREDDARRAPSFESIRGKRRRTTSPVVVLFPAAIAAAAVLVVWCHRPESATPTAVVAAAPVPASGESLAVPPADDAPLDFLLRVPALRGAPDFDTSLLRGSLR